MLSPCLLRGRLFCRLAVRRQRLFELLFDTEGVGGGARPEFPQDMGLRSRQVASVSVSPGGAGRRDATHREIAVMRLLAGMLEIQSGAPRNLQHPVYSA